MEGEKYLETSRINKTLKSDMFLKIASVFIAITLWAYVSLVLDPETTKQFKDVPVRFINEQDINNLGLAVVDEGYSVSFEVKGRRDILSTIDNERIWAVADLSVINKVGRNRMSIKISGLPSTVSLVVDPEDIFVEVDKSLLVSKQIAIELRGEPQKGFKTGVPVVNPADIQIDGPQKLVNEIHSVNVLVDVSSLENNFTTKEKVRILDSKGNEISGLKTDVDSVEITVPVGKGS